MPAGCEFATPAPKSYAVHSQFQRPSFSTAARSGKDCRLPANDLPQAGRSIREFCPIPDFLEDLAPPHDLSARPSAVGAMVGVRSQRRTPIVGSQEASPGPPSITWDGVFSGQPVAQETFPGSPVSPPFCSTTDVLVRRPRGARRLPFGQRPTQTSIGRNCDSRRLPLRHSTCVIRHPLLSGLCDSASFLFLDIRPIRGRLFSSPLSAPPR